LTVTSDLKVILEMAKVDLDKHVFTIQMFVKCFNGEKLTTLQNKILIIVTTHVAT